MCPSKFRGQDRRMRNALERGSVAVLQSASARESLQASCDLTFEGDLTALGQPAGRAGPQCLRELCFSLPVVCDTLLIHVLGIIREPTVWRFITSAPSKAKKSLQPPGSHTRADGVTRRGHTNHRLHAGSSQHGISPANPGLVTISITIRMHVQNV